MMYVVTKEKKVILHWTEPTEILYVYKIIMRPPWHVTGKALPKWMEVL